jgi:hypothetical protein
LSQASTTFQYPIDVVWPHLLNQAAWMTDSKVEKIAGKRDREGEVKKLTPPLPQYQPFFFKTLRLFPFRKFLYKAYTQSRGGAYGFTGLEILSLDSFGIGSALTFEAYLEFQSEEMSSAEMARFVAEMREGSTGVRQRNFRRLAALINSERA